MREFVRYIMSPLIFKKKAVRVLYETGYNGVY